MMKNNNEEVQSIKKPFDYVGFKVGFSFVVILLVAIVSLSAVIGIFNGAVNSLSEEKASSVMTNVMIKFIPETIETPDGKYVFGIEKNNDYDSSKDLPADVFSFYRLHSDGEKEYIESGIYKDENGEDIQVVPGFMLATTQQLGEVSSNVKTALTIVSLVLVADVIWMSYYLWAYHEDLKAAGLSKSDKNSK